METEVQAKVLKIGTLWATIGITSWAELASFLAVVYSLLLIGEWLWKKAIKPMLISRGYIKIDRRRKADRDE